MRGHGRDTDDARSVAVAAREPRRPVVRLPPFTADLAVRVIRDISEPRRD